MKKQSPAELASARASNLEDAISNMLYATRRLASELTPDERRYRERDLLRYAREYGAAVRRVAKARP